MANIPAIVVVLSACSHDCYQSFWQLFDSSPPEILRTGRDPGLSRFRGSWSAVRNRSFPGFETHRNCTERRPGSRVDAVATPSWSPSAFAGWFSHDAISRCPSRAVCDSPGLLPLSCSSSSLTYISSSCLLAEKSGVTSFKDLQVHWFLWAEKETQCLFLDMGWPLHKGLRILIDVRGSGQDYSTGSTFHLRWWWSESVECWRCDQATTSDNAFCQLHWCEVF